MNKHDANERQTRSYQKAWKIESTFKQIKHMVGSTTEKTCLDTGGINGVLSVSLRTLGGTWRTINMGKSNADIVRQVLGEEIIDGDSYPWSVDKGSFDAVVVVDQLEFLQDVASFIAECHRVLTPSGCLIVVTPHAKRSGILGLLRKLFGLVEGDPHQARIGYTESELFDILKDGFDVMEVRSYSRFFVECVHTFVSLFVHAAKEDKVSATRTRERMDRIYTWSYPFYWIADKLDGLLFFTRGYTLIASAKRRIWRPRRNVLLADGRSIAEAAIHTKIGTAAPF